MKGGECWNQQGLGHETRYGKIIEKVHFSRYFDSPETDLDITTNADCIDYTDTWPLNRVH